MFELLIKTILAHLIGDFVLQTDTAVKDLSEKKFRSKYLYLHYVIHFVLLWIFTGLLLPSLILSTIHIVLDIFTKFYLNREKYSFPVLVFDQLLHLLSIGIFVHCFYKYDISWDKVFSTQNYLLLTVLVLITFTGSVFIKNIMNYFSKFKTDELGSMNAGKMIGILERLFIFTFIVIHFWEGIGFLLAAKSILRFGDLKENKDIQLSEYVLIGTLLSFGWAILFGLLYMKLRM